MKRILLILALVLVGAVAFQQWYGPKIFHARMPFKDVAFRVVDDSGRGIRATQIVTRTTYWYPSLLGQANSVAFEDKFMGDDGGRVAAKIKQHHQVTQITLKISASGYETYETKVYNESKWLEGLSPQRTIPLVRVGSPVPVQTVLWSKDGSWNEIRVQWRGKPLWLSFASRTVSEDEGDLRIDIGRSAAGSAQIEDQPVSMRISYPAGLLQMAARNEVAFDLGNSNRLAAWGDISEIVRSRSNIRHMPCFSESFVFSSADKKVRGALSVSCDPVQEWPGEPATVVLRFYGRVEFYK